MKWLYDIFKRKVRLTDERIEHIENDHPEMSGQIDKIEETLALPDVIIRSKVDTEVELFSRHYPRTPVTEKYMCVVVKAKGDDCFIITAYFTDSVKKGGIIWEKK
jgi:DNA-directed RNA polymerase specialized sigma54-like protein